MTHLLMTLVMTLNQRHSLQAHSQGGVGGEDEWSVEQVEEAEQEETGRGQALECKLLVNLAEF